jgi:hypothetical protein
MQPVEAMMKYNESLQKAGASGITPGGADS